MGLGKKVALFGIVVLVMAKTCYAATGDVGPIREIFLAGAVDGSWSPDGAQIAYSKGGNIFIYTPELDERKQITSGPPAEFGPRWSPDGNRLCFYVPEASDGKWGFNVWLIDADGQNRMQLTERGVGGSLDWSPDGNSIATWVSIGNAYEIVTIDVMTGEVRILTEGMSLFAPRWSPDGNKIVCWGQSEDAPGRNSIWIVETDGSGPKEIVASDWEHGAYNPSWSPDQQKIVFSSAGLYEDYQEVLWMCDADGSNPRRLTAGSNDYRDGYPDWHPDGRKIMFSSDRSGQWAFYLLELPSDLIVEGKTSQTAKDYYNKGIDYGVAGKFDQAQQEFTKALAADPFYEPPKLSLEIVEDVLKQRIKTETALYMFKGGAYGNKRMFDDAIAEFKKAIEINPDYAKAYNSLGIIYGEKGMYNEEIAEYKKAIAINPNYAEAHYNLGITYEHNPEGIRYGRGSKLNDAIAEYKKATAINPNYVKAHYNLGIIYGKKGMYNEALAQLKRVIEINPNYAEGQNALAIAYYSKGKYSLAIKHCDRAIELGYSIDPKFLELLGPYREK